MIHSEPWFRRDEAEAGCWLTSRSSLCLEKECCVTTISNIKAIKLKSSAADNAYLQPDPKFSTLTNRTGDEMRKTRKQ